MDSDSRQRVAPSFQVMPEEGFTFAIMKQMNQNESSSHVILFLQPSHSDTSMTTKAPLVSIIIPMFNEGSNVEPLYEILVTCLAPLNDPYEIIFVDDGSTDDTWTRIDALAKMNPTIIGISFSRNFGHQNALFAGLLHSKGQALISLDGDLQHPPELILKLVDQWKSGYKVINTKREDHIQTSFFKRATSKYFYVFFSILSGVQIDEGSSDFRLIDRHVLEAMKNFNDAGLFIRGMVNWTGFRSTTVTYKAQSRHAGRSKYNLIKMMAFASNAVVSFSTKPLILAIYLGIATSFFAFLEIIYVFYHAALGHTVSGWASTVGLISLLFGILFILLGILGLYLARIHESLQGRPRFVINDTTSHNTP